MVRAARLGGRFVSSHFGHYRPGSAGFSLPLSPPAAPLRTLAASIRSLLADAPPGVQLLLENSAGCRAGSPNPAFGADWSDFAQLFDLLDGDERVGVCFDTCHAHAAGHRVDSARWVGRTLRDFDRVIGLSRLRLIHLNDSRGAAGSHIDRHQHIGRGTIGDEGFRALLRRRDLRVPKASACGVQAEAYTTRDRCAILETPIDRPGDDRRNLRQARMLREV
jgi:deoxyribonuclease-4